MSGPQLLIVTVIIVFVIAFAITMILLNNHAKSLVSTNKKLVENQNTLLEQNMQHEFALEKRIDELEEQLKHPAMDELTLLQKQTHQQREHIVLTANMSDEELLAWINQEMEERRLYTDNNLTLKTLAKALGLTQKRFLNTLNEYFVDGNLLCMRWINNGAEYREWWDIASIENNVMSWTALREKEDGTTYTASFSMTKIND